MGWVVKLDAEHHVNLDDIHPDVFDQIALEDPEASWYGVYQAPGGNTKRMYAVICAAAKLVGVEPPPAPTSMREANDMLSMFDTVDDIEDLPMVDGFPQMPDAPETGSGFGVPGDSDGPKPKPSETTQSETS